MTTDTAVQTTPGRFTTLMARLLEVILGVVFIASALLKAADVNGFMGAIGNYHVLPSPNMEGPVALATLAVESFLGISMVLGLKARRFTLGLTAAMVLVFSALIAYAWAFHGLKDCGCSGSLKMGPASSLAKNAGLLVVAFLAWRGFRRGTGMVFSAGEQGRTLLVALLGAALVVGYAAAQSEPAPPTAAANDGAFSQFSIEQDGVTYNLAKGEFLVAMLSTTCDHCMKSVEALNALAETPGLPQVVGLCKGDAVTLELFRSGTAPEYPFGIAAVFPLALIGNRVFDSIVPVAPPRFVLVRDGKEVKAWDDSVPSADDVRAQLTVPPAAENRNSG